MTQDTTPTPMGGFTITSQVEGQYQTPTGQWAQGMKITFATPDGLQGSVTVPESGYTPDNVRAAIATKLATMRAVQQLGTR